MRWNCLILSLLTFTVFFDTCIVSNAGQDERTPESAYDVLVSREEAKTRAPFLFLLYQRVISEHNGAKCFFYPTCSDFFRRSFTRYGFFWAAVMTVDRVFYRENEGSLRFYPYLKGKDLYYDPVSRNFIFNGKDYYQENDRDQ